MELEQLQVSSEKQGFATDPRFELGSNLEAPTNAARPLAVSHLEWASLKTWSATMLAGEGGANSLMRKA